MDKDKATTPVKTAPPPRAKEPEASTRPGRSGSGLRRPFELACCRYVHGLQEAQRDAWERWRAAYRQYHQALHGIYQDLYKAAGEAYRVYLREVEGACSEPEGRERVQRAYEEYRRAVEAAQKEASGRLEQAQREYAQAAEQAGREGQDQSQELLQGYLKDVQAAWSEVDVKGMDTEDLAIASRSAMAAAQYACCAPSLLGATA